MLLARANMCATSGLACRRPVVAFQPAHIRPARRIVNTVKCLAAEVVEAAPAPTISGPKAGLCHYRNQRGSVYKIRRVLQTIKGKSYEEALVLMEYMPYRACEKIIKCLISAAANAKNNQGALKSKLVVSECYADQGPVMKRMRCRAQGRGNVILKPTFHMYIKVEEKTA